MLGFLHNADGTIQGLGGFFGLSFVEDSGRLVGFDTSKVVVIIGRELTVIKEGETRTFKCVELSEAIAQLSVELDAAADAAVADREMELQRRSSALDLREGKLEIRERALEEREAQAAAD